MLGDEAWGMGGFVENMGMGPDLWKQSELPQGIASSRSLSRCSVHARKTLGSRLCCTA